MKTFQQFNEETKKEEEKLKKSLDPLKQLGKEFAEKGKEFANSDDAKNLKNNVLNMFIGKGKELLKKGGAKLDDIETKVNK